ncbi:hypothetical protein, partial [Streptomyces sp. SID11385]|uniref:hypothetical protein n=1 Tax=Streptomyces sp. SID11385 TaxID=2706031 RepID=UPI0013C7FE9D
MGGNRARHRAVRRGPFAGRGDGAGRGGSASVGAGSSRGTPTLLRGAMVTAATCVVLAGGLTGVLTRT